MGQITACGIALLGLVLPNQACAQFTGDYQTNIINGTTVNWPGLYYYVGSNYVGDALFILNGGSLSNLGLSYIGYESGANSNLVVVSDSGSVWNSGTFYVGHRGAGNELVVRNGGRRVVSQSSSVGLYSNSNHVLVTDSGSVWSMLNLWMGDGGAYNSMVISNGGLVHAAISGYVGGNVNGGGRSNIVIVTGAGSVWTNSDRLNIGYMNRGNTLIVANGGAVFNAGLGIIGTRGNAANNHVLVTGNGSVWRSSAELLVGWGTDGGPHTNNQLTITDAGSVLASSVYLGVNPSASNSLVSVSGGNLTATNLSGTGSIDVRRGRLAFNGGTITVDRLRLTNDIESILDFASGTLHSAGSAVSNAQPCVVGDGVASGNFHLLGGVHSFENGLRIRTHSFLSGCGTINGSVVVDAGGAVHVNCTNLVFNSAVTNNGSMVVDGAVLETFGAFVNNGTIYLINGGTTNFHGSFINNGQILNGDIRLAIEVDGSSGLFVRYSGVPTVTYRLQRAASLSGPWSGVATNAARASGFVEYHETTPPPGQAFYRTAQP